MLFRNFTLTLGAALAATSMAPCALSQGHPYRQVSLLAGSLSAGDLKTEQPSIKIAADSGTGYTLLLNQLQRTAETNVDLQYEILVSQNTLTLSAPSEIIPSQEAELTSTHLQIGGTYEWRYDTATPYVGGTLGASHLSLSEAGSDTVLGYSVAGGIRFTLSSTVSLRFEARAIGVSLSSETDFFCSTARGGCIINMRNDTWWQKQLSAGLSFNF